MFLFQLRLLININIKVKKPFNRTLLVIFILIITSAIGLPPGASMAYVVSFLGDVLDQSNTIW